MSPPAEAERFPSDSRLPPPWGTRRIEEGEALQIRLGTLSLWFRRCDGEIRIAIGQDEAGGETDPPDDERWVRWAVPDGSDSIRLVPVLPDRPVVVEPEIGFRILRQAEARVYVRVALWVRIELGDTGIALQEVPVVPMSDTWFGGFLDGELCYWHATTARREVRAEHLEPHLAVCPLQLTNHGAGELNVQTIALRVVHLSLFAGGNGGIWADETRVRYEGDELGSRIDMTGQPPREAPGAVLVAPPRIPIQRNLRTRTFARLKAISGLAGPL